VLSAYSSIQEVVDRSVGYEVNRCCEVLSNEALLPAPEEFRKPSEENELGSYGAFGRVVT
jgi:hypothetical protein